MLIQINHAGRQVPRHVMHKYKVRPIGPTTKGIKGGMGLFGRPECVYDMPGAIDSIIDQFAGAASLAVSSGFQGVQIHMAHGYLLSSILADDTRPLQARTDLVCRVVAAVRRAVGPSAVVAVKVNASDFTDPSDCVHVCTGMQAEGLDLIEVSGGTYEKVEFMVEADGDPSSAPTPCPFLPVASRVAAAVDIPVCVTGGLVRCRQDLDTTLAAGATLVGAARPFTRLSPTQLAEREREREGGKEGYDAIPLSALLDMGARERASGGIPLPRPVLSMMRRLTRIFPLLLPGPTAVYYAERIRAEAWGAEGGPDAADAVFDRVGGWIGWFARTVFSYMGIGRGRWMVE
ncbi:hypothetical protein KIPB_007468 [Kipferlia bialata]|uniref:NADH:flavin oxidoreductase/NADH oxidase N-terminal domain-containing protein n=1 Tax=Kipferlia bialata TaxID=797122 RepID=A0A9K3D0B0_9EUKA|nr:hypothetical protein KIPB_007468 [Kipferlia bialata]|eukprot:g7468.t1